MAQMVFRQRRERPAPTHGNAGSCSGISQPLRPQRPPGRRAEPERWPGGTARREEPEEGTRASDGSHPRPARRDSQPRTSNRSRAAHAQRTAGNRHAIVKDGLARRTRRGWTGLLSLPKRMRITRARRSGGVYCSKSGPPERPVAAMRRGPAWPEHRQGVWHLPFALQVVPKYGVRAFGR
jgi:hypothetical protein